MSDAHRPGGPLDDVLDAALARTVRRAAPADLRARVMASVGQGQPRGARPLAIWTAVAAAAVVTVVIAAQAMRRPVAPSASTANLMPVATAAPVLKSLAPADTPAGARRVATPGTGRSALTAAIRADRPRLADGNPPLEAAVDEPAALVIDPLEHAVAPIVPLHTDDLAIVPLAIDDVGSLSSEDRP